MRACPLTTISSTPSFPVHFPCPALLCPKAPTPTCPRPAAYAPGDSRYADERLLEILALLRPPPICMGRRSRSIDSDSFCTAFRAKFRFFLFQKGGHANGFCSTNPGTQADVCFFRRVGLSPERGRQSPRLRACICNRGRTPRGISTTNFAQLTNRRRTTPRYIALPTHISPFFFS